MTKKSDRKKPEHTVFILTVFSLEPGTSAVRELAVDKVRGLIHSPWVGLLFAGARPVSLSPSRSYDAGRVLLSNTYN